MLFFNFPSAINGAAWPLHLETHRNATHTPGKLKNGKELLEKSRKCFIQFVQLFFRWVMFCFHILQIRLTILFDFHDDIFVTNYFVLWAVHGFYLLLYCYFSRENIYFFIKHICKVWLVSLLAGMLLCRYS